MQINKLKTNIIREQPLVSVVMSVYNTKEEYLREAIESILTQTYKTFEYIIIDDACEERTRRIIESYDDSRIKIFRNEKNIGLTASLNIGIKEAMGKYIARMDADDVSYPQRLEQSVLYMERNPQIGLIGTYVKWGKRTEKSYGKLNSSARKALFIINNAGPVHPSAMIRKSFLDEYSLTYNEEYKKAQDYELWIRCLEHTELVVVPQVLLFYRIHQEQISEAQRLQQDIYANELKARMLCLVNLEYSIDAMLTFVRSRLKAEMDFEDYLELTKEIIEDNRLSRTYEDFWMKYVMAWYVFKYYKYNVAKNKRLIYGMRLVFSKYLLYFIIGYMRILVAEI